MLIRRWRQRGRGGWTGLHSIAYEWQAAPLDQSPTVRSLFGEKWWIGSLGGMSLAMEVVVVELEGKNSGATTANESD